jgi:predicted  nucleic acid-binding Zn-ribbon protein
MLLLSVGLVATWVYHFYDKANYSLVKSESSAKDSIELANVVRDSLQKAYTATISTLDFKLDSSRNTSDSLNAELSIKQAQLANKVSEVNKLKTEISTILRNPKSTNTELAVARDKMNELERIVRELRDEKTALEQEKKDLSARLDQVTGEVSTLQQNIKRLDDENKNLTEKIKLASTFVASALHFTAVNVMTEKEQETSLARKADKFIASFVLQNNFNEYPNAEIMIVITEPDGSVLQSSTWDSGSFETKTEGKKSYTRKMRFDYAKGEQKSLIFTLDAAGFQKGTYRLQIWHNGIMVGSVEKVLS